MQHLVEFMHWGMYGVLKANGRYVYIVYMHNIYVIKKNYDYNKSTGFMKMCPIYLFALLHSTSTDIMKPYALY